MKISIKFLELFFLFNFLLTVILYFKIIAFDEMFGLVIAYLFFVNLISLIIMALLKFLMDMFFYIVEKRFNIVVWFFLINIVYQGSFTFIGKIPIVNIFLSEKKYYQGEDLLVTLVPVVIYIFSMIYRNVKVDTTKKH